MKKILYSIFAIALALPTMASAATFSFAPTTATYTPGKTFSVAVFVNPSAGETITTAKLSLKIPADMLEVVSFTPTTGWIALPLPGSDLVDNTNGKLIKTGGYPAKVTSTKQFGTILFKAKKSGTANLNTNADSMLIDTANTNKYTSSKGATFIVEAPKPVVKVKPKQKVKKTVKSKTKPVVTQEAVKSVVATTTPEVATTTATTTTSGQTASVSESTNSDNNNGFFTTKVIVWSSLFILLVLAWLLFFLKKKKD